MTATINYDRPVLNLIDQLSATRHVSHRSYTKKSVTLHHNGGRLSHQGVLNVWKTRPASAHFDVDSAGAVAQYVKVDEYAWAVGNVAGNQSTISIEMANATLAPGWTVADVTWKNAARLAGWLFAKVIGARPSKSNFFYHHHWSSTACAGPYMDKIYDKVLFEAQKAYDTFKAKPAPSAPSPSTSRKTDKEIAREVLAGKWGNGQERIDRLRTAGYDPNAVQAQVNILTGKKTAAAVKKTVSQIASEVIDGKWSTGDDRKKRLTAAGYDPAKVQAEVNRLLGVQTKKSVTTIAREVIAGKWGNGDVRVRRLRTAGYNPTAIQAEVNRLV